MSMKTNSFSPPFLSSHMYGGIFYYNSRLETASTTAIKPKLVPIKGLDAPLVTTAAARLALTKLGPQLTFTCIAALT